MNLLCVKLCKLLYSFCIKYGKSIFCLCFVEVYQKSDTFFIDQKVNVQVNLNKNKENVVKFPFQCIVLFESHFFKQTRKMLQEGKL